MPISSVIPTVLCVLLAGLVLAGRRLGARWFLGGGLLLLGLEQGLAGWAASAIVPSDVAFRQTLRFFVTALLPFFWMVFGSEYGRALQEGGRRARFLLGGSAGLTALLLVLLPFGRFFETLPGFEETGEWVLPLGIRGYLFHILLVLVFTSIVAQLERTLRASIGRARWQIKFAVLGLGGLFAVRIYTSSTAMLFRAWTTSQDVLHAWALVLAVALLVVALRRGGLFKVDIYVSQSALRGSITTVVVGAYLVGVGLVAHVLNVLGWSAGMRDVLVFVALMSVLAVLLSDRVRQDLRRLTRQHFRRPSHDYRLIWTRFSGGTADRTDDRAVGRTLVSIVADTLECLTVALWVRDPRQGSLRLVASTGMGKELESRDLQALAREAEAAEGLLEFPPEEAGEGEPSTGRRTEGLFSTIKASKVPQPLRVVPLKRHKELVGILALTDRVRAKPLSFEDYELLEVLAGEAAAVLSNIGLSRQLKEATELEAFQQMSAFFLHDLKNLASRLSLTVQNFPKYQDNPEFRQEALATIAESVEKIRGICSRLSLVREMPEVDRSAVDLNDWLTGVVSELRNDVGDSLAVRLDPVGRALIDRTQFRKVVVNLVLNAWEAVQQKNARAASGGSVEGASPQRERAGEGREGVLGKADILMTTRYGDGMIILEVQDRGVGMEKKFVEERLFHPFQTTKKDGMGIGLFQSRMIVELHGGKMEVETEAGRGTTVRVLLPRREEVQSSESLA